MTNKIALALGLFILSIFAVDYVLIGADIHVFLARKFADLIEYIAFWR